MILVEFCSVLQIVKIWFSNIIFAKRVTNNLPHICHSNKKCTRKGAFFVMTSWGLFLEDSTTLKGTYERGILERIHCYHITTPVSGQFLGYRDVTLGDDVTVACYLE